MRRYWLRSRLSEINEALVATSLGYQSKIVQTGEVIDVDGDARVVHNQLYRIFNGCFELGGRFYGAWWQNIRSAERRKILIKGSTTVEID